MVSLFLLLGCNLSYIVDLLAALHERLASASARTLLKLASSVRALKTLWRHLNFQWAYFDSFSWCVHLSYGVCRLRARVQRKTLFLLYCLWNEGRLQRRMFNGVGKLCLLAALLLGYTLRCLHRVLRARTDDASFSNEIGRASCRERV